MGDDGAAENEGPPQDKKEAKKQESRYATMANELLELKAKTMYRMVEDVDLGSKKKKVVFLRNNQAQHLVDDSVNEDGKGIKLLMTALELKHQPEMVNPRPTQCTHSPIGMYSI